MNIDECPVCESVSIKVKSAPFEFLDGTGKEVIISDAERYHCDGCGEEFFTPDQTRELLKRKK